MLNPLLSVLAGSILLLSCSHERKVIPYADSRGFFNEQIEHLQQTGTGVHKTIFFGAKQEDGQLDHPDWQKELSLFTEIDLLKPSFAGRFKVDTLTIADTAYEVTYHSSDNTLELKDVKLGYINNRIGYITANYTQANKLYQSEKTMVYNAHKGYKITGNQEVRLGKNTNYSIEAVFTNR